jgi:hypothetical protein
MVICKLKCTICPGGGQYVGRRFVPSRQNVGIKFPATYMSRAVRYGMSVENAGGLSNPVPAGTECGDCHIAYLTARGKLVAVHFSTNILSLTGQRKHYMLFMLHAGYFFSPSLRAQ